MVETKIDRHGLDTEWVQLIMEAKNAGLKIEEIKKFLLTKQIHNKDDQ